MSASRRLVLLGLALLCGGIFALLGIVHSRVAEPAAAVGAGTLFWMTAGTVVFFPMWAPALVPARFPRLLRACRRAGAIGLGLPLYLFGSAVVHQIERLAFASGGSVLGLAIALSVMGGCVIGMLALLWPPPCPDDAAQDACARTASHARRARASIVKSATAA